MCGTQYADALVCCFTFSDETLLSLIDTNGFICLIYVIVFCSLVSVFRINIELNIVLSQRLHQRKQYFNIFYFSDLTAVLRDSVSTVYVFMLMIFGLNFERLRLTLWKLLSVMRQVLPEQTLSSFDTAVRKFAAIAYMTLRSSKPTIALFFGGRQSLAWLIVDVYRDLTARILIMMLDNKT